LDVGRRAIDLAKSLGKQKVRYDQTTQQQRSILNEGGIVNQAYYDAQQITVGPVREVLDEYVAPDRFFNQDVPDQSAIKLTAQQAEANAWAVAGWDIGVASITSGGYLMMALGALTMDPAAVGFGYFLTTSASVAATASVLDTAITSGPNTNAYTVSGVTYSVGMLTSFVPIAWVDLGAAWLQVAYDAYSIDYMYRHPRP